MLYFSHLDTAIKLVDNYRHNEPLQAYLKDFFKQNKKYGSRDRKLISSLCYSYFRLGHTLKSYDTRYRILLGFFLVQKSSTPFLESLKPEWNAEVSKPIDDKIQIAGVEQEIQFFSFNNELSAGLDAREYGLSFLQQPKLFVRIRPGFNDVVFAKLQAANIAFERIDNDCLAFMNATKIEDVLDIGKEVIIQDKNSQKSGKIFKPYLDSLNVKSIWDCCAGSGGKSIMAYDLNNKLFLTVSDKRASILSNLSKRFKKAGIKNYSSFIADLETITLSELSMLVKGQSFDAVIADVPCTGSGTWARTPEDLYSFKKSSIKKYVSIQQQVIKKSIPLLKEGAIFIYITCSVFKQENEDQADFIENEGLTLLQSVLLTSYNEQADTLFISIFKK